MHATSGRAFPWVNGGKPFRKVGKRSSTGSADDQYQLGSPGSSEKVGKEMGCCGVEMLVGVPMGAGKKGKKHQ